MSVPLPWPLHAGRSLNYLFYSIDSKARSLEVKYVVNVTAHLCLMCTLDTPGTNLLLLFIVSVLFKHEEKFVALCNRY